MADERSQSASRSGFSVKARSFVRSAASSHAQRLKAAIWIRPLIALLILAAMGWFLRKAIEDVIRDELASELQTLLETDVTALRIWMETQEANAIAAAGDRQVV